MTEGRNIAILAAALLQGCKIERGHEIAEYAKLKGVLEYDDRKIKQHNKKPGIKDIVKVVSSLIQEVQIAQERINELYGVIDMYIEFKHDDKKFKKHLDKKVEELKTNDNKTDERVDGGDTDGDKEDAGIRAEGIRS